MTSFWTRIWCITSISVFISTAVGEECCLRCNGTRQVVKVGAPQIIRGDPDRSQISYPKNSICDFNVSPPTIAYFLRIETSNFHLRDSLGCEEEYVEIFADQRAGSNSPDGLRSVGKWCGTSYGKILDINENVKIRYKNQNNSKSGFSISITSRDPNSYDESEHHVVKISSVPAHIYSVGYPVRYRSSSTMAWALTGADGTNVINIEAVDFHLEDSSSCEYDRLTISSGSQKIEWCGKRGRQLYSFRENINMTFSTDDRLIDKGFHLRVYTTPYQMNNCSSSITAFPVPQLLSLTSAHRQRSDCSWLISSTSDYDVISLEIASWDESVLVCGVSPVRVFDGPDVSSIRLVDNCGGATPFGFIRSSSNSVLVTSGLNAHDPTKIKDGFTIKYHFLKKLYFERQPYKAIRSKSYMWIPPVHAENTRPVISFRADDDKRCVAVQVLTEWLKDVSDSYTKYLDVYDGTDHRSRLVGACTSQDKSSISGTHSTLRIEAKRGQRGFWLTIDTTSRCIGDWETLVVTEQKQDLHITLSHVTDLGITSDVECYWTLAAEDNDLIHVDIMRIKLPNTHTSCQENYVTAYTGEDAQRSKVSTWCDGAVNPNITSFKTLSLQAKLTDLSSASASYRMLHLKYWKQRNYDCEGVQLTATTEWKELTSPGFPSNYPNNARCSWILSSSVPPYHVRLEIMEVNTDKCLNDVISVYDGKTKLQDYCGDGFQVMKVESTGRSLNVSFSTDELSTARGFKFSYYAVNPNTEPRAGEIVVEADDRIQYLTSPNYPEPYDTGIMVMWAIRAAKDSEVVTLKLIQDGVKNPCRSRYDALTVFDGYKSHSLLGHFCGERTSKVFQSRSRTADIRLMSATSGIGHGYSGTFKISYISSKPDRACLPGEVQELSAVEYWKILDFPPNSENYPKNAECRWRVKAPNTTTTIIIEVLFSNLEESYTCAYDVVKVYDGFDSSSLETGIFCGGQTPKFYSSTRYFYLVFTSDAANEGTGFQLRYRLTNIPQLPTTDTGNSGHSIGLLVGGILGGVFLLIVIVVGFLCYMCSSKRRSGRHPEGEPVVNNSNNNTVFVLSPVFMGDSTSGALPPPYPGLSDLPPAYPGLTEAYNSASTGASAAGTNLSVDAVTPPPYSEPDSIPMEKPPDYEEAIRASMADTSRGGNSGNSPLDLRSREQRQNVFEYLGPV